jgi:L-iditol 2-dehydrogenase
MEFFASPPIDGAFAEFVAIQADYAHAIPDSMSFEAAALCEPLSVGIWANQKAETQPGSRVLIAGAGPIGVIAMQVALQFGAAEVIIADIVPSRRERAVELGATRALDPAVDKIDTLEVHAFIDSSGAAGAIRSGILAVKPAGHVVLVGMGKPDLEVPVARIQNRELMVTGTFRYANTWPLAIQLAASGAVDLDALVSGRFDLDHAGGAPATAQDVSTLKNLVLRGEQPS